MHNYNKIGKVLQRFLTVESTNDIAKDMLSKTKPSSGSVIIADFQTKGRGQRTNSWESEDGKNILCSIILLHQIDTELYFYLNKIICIAIVELLNELLPSETIEIKWPNDILVNKHKIAGILIENAIINNHIQHSIIGIGLNVNQTNFQVYNAISVTQCTYRLENREMILQKLLTSIDHWYKNLLDQKYNLIDSVYMNLLYGTHQTFTYIAHNEKQIGQITSVNKDGSITILNSALNQSTTFYFKEIQFIL